MSTPPDTTLLQRGDPDWMDPELSPELGAGSPGGGIGAYAHALRRRWAIALVLGLACGAAAAASAWFGLPRTYTTTAVLRIAQSEQPFIFQTADLGGQSTFDIYKRTQRQLVLSRFVLEEALNTLSNVPRVEEIDSAWLATNLRVSFPDDAELMHVELSDTRPDDLPALVNAVVDSYMREVAGEKVNLDDRLDILVEAYRQTEDDLRNKRNNLHGLSLSQADDAAESTVIQERDRQQLAAALSRLAELQFELRHSRAEQELLRNAVGDASGITVSEQDLRDALAKDRAAAQLTTEREILVQRMEETRTRIVAAKAKPYLDDYQQQIDAVDAKLKAREAALGEELSATKKRTVESQTELRQQQLSARIEMLSAEERDLETQLTALQKQAARSAGAVGQPSVDIEMLQVDIRTAEAVLGRVADEIEQIKVEQAARAEQEKEQGQAAKDRDRVRVIAEAAKPQPADPRTQMFRAGGAAGAGLILPFVLLVWWDARKRRINTPAELTSQLRVSMLGSLPLVPNRVMRQLGGPSKQAHFWRNLLSESVDSIAAVILSDPEPRRVIMVSSATAGEGKTTLAGHLAISLAAGADRRTLLIDFDLRRPALHRIFGLEAGPGVGEVLRGELSVQDALQETDIPKLHLIPAGTAKQRGLGLLGSSSALAALFEELRSSFDFILVDGCPILPVVDTRLVAQHADAVILSVLRDVSRAPKVSAACEILESFKIPLLGVVMTGSSSDIYQEIAADRYLEVQPVE